MSEDYRQTGHEEIRNRRHSFANDQLAPPEPAQIENKKPYVGDIDKNLSVLSHDIGSFLPALGNLLRTAAKTRSVQRSSRGGLGYFGVLAQEMLYYFSFGYQLG